MKTRLIIATIPVMVVGGMILFLGCGAQTQKAGHAETGSSLSAATVAAIPGATNLTAAPAEAVPKIVTAPPKLSPGVDEIVQLAQAGVGDEVLQAYIENSPVAYRLNVDRSEEHTSELQSQSNLVCRLLLEKKKQRLHSHLGHAVADNVTRLLFAGN